MGDIKLKEIGKRVVEVDRIISALTRGGFLKRGYMCGIVNGLRIASAIMRNKKEGLILERNENQELSRDDIEIAVDESGNLVLMFFKNENLEKIKRI